ncbi:MAG: hypothetical protein LBK40_07365 [Spirochaetaceae bacterium]|jgi:hypothetical protein|nr:hypothetical protein [Spirochaetaceae bacterium]
MLQFYFLSVAANALSGFILFTGHDEEEDTSPGFRFSPENRTFRLVLGIVSALTGVLKILSVIPGDIPVIGDLIPALAGFFAGFALIFKYYRQGTSLSSDRSEKIAALIAVNQRWVGVAAMASSALHFLFPTVLLL